MHRSAKPDPRDEEVGDGRGSPLPALLEACLGAARDAGARAAAGPWLGECLADEHPAGLPRVKVRGAPTGAGPEAAAWLPRLQGLVVRAGDRVLLLRPLNHPEPLVVGVLDGFVRRSRPPREVRATLSLRADEGLRVRDAEGRDLLELRGDDGQPSVRLLSRDVRVETDGALRIEAERLELVARAGPARVVAAEDVVIEGEIVRLN
ncbi:MAG: hypothetical protein ACFCGT_18860 [Sandaracinaceae bacterium]